MCTRLDLTPEGMELAGSLAGRLPQGHTLLGTIVTDTGHGNLYSPMTRGPDGRYHRVAQGDAYPMDTDIALNILDKAEGATVRSKVVDSRLFPQGEDIRTAASTSPWEGGNS